MDRITKSLLFFVALGLWANALSACAVLPPVSAAQDDWPFLTYRAVGHLESAVTAMQSEVSGIRDALDRIERGSCSNSKIC